MTGHDSSATPYHTTSRGAIPRARPRQAPFRARVPAHAAALASNARRDVRADDHVYHAIHLRAPRGTGAIARDGARADARELAKPSSDVERRRAFETRDDDDDDDVHRERED